MLAILLAIFITISDADQRQYVQVSEVRRAMAVVADTSHLRPQDCQTIEQAIRRVPMVRKAECYLRTNGDMVVTLTQREPVYRVVTDNTAYWVDTDRNPNPIKLGIVVNVPVVYGNISQEAACGEVYELVEAIHASTLFSSRLKAIRIDSHNEVTVHWTDGKRVLLGKMSEDYRERIGRLETLYEKGFKTLGEPECKEFDLRYKGQVVQR